MGWTTFGAHRGLWGVPRLVGWTIFGVRHRWCGTPHEFTSPEGPSGKPDFLLLQHLQ